MTESKCPFSNLAENNPPKESDELPKTYPGRIVSFPDDVDHLVFGMFGIQHTDENLTEVPTYLSELIELLQLPHGAMSIERAHHIDKQGFHNQVILGYWLGRDSYDLWVESPTVKSWWANRSVSGHSKIGYWREVMSPSQDHFSYGAGKDEKSGSAAILPLIPSDRFGYWGSYRHRINASATDQLKSPLPALPAPQPANSRGLRLKVKGPDYMCFIREAQYWEKCGEKERAVWHDKMVAPVQTWIDFLSSNPVQTGCMSIRFCREQDVMAGTPLDRQSQFGLLLSLGHIEQAARTQASHLCVRKEFTDLYVEPEYVPQLHPWVEVHILKSNELLTEYINCHELTGLLPYFASQIADPSEKFTFSTELPES
ncbi:phenylacetaldoxime dehydratase family protein [Pseudomonas sp. NPDC089752]|uniref:phenylacetaldoxime dehydratase family protein n=1 Tax=Pseudomonas sp. NPDC089752 TaxID=3364472 RepID=UPI0038300736